MRTGPRRPRACRFDILPWLLWIVVAGVLFACGACGSSTPPRPAICGGDAFDAWVSNDAFCVHVFASGLGRARQMAFAPNGDLFVSSNGGVAVLFDEDGSGSISSTERSAFASASGLNHGLAFSRDGQYLYASSETTVYRWRYTTGLRRATGSPEIAISGIPAGGHVTRTLAFDSTGRLYVSVGSATNVDVDPVQVQTRSQIRRFAIPATLPVSGLSYATGEVIASGMRNEVGLYIDGRDRLWSVENGRDALTHNGDIHNENPAEEVNLVDGTGSKYYGYPSCYTEFRRSDGEGPGAQWADITLATANRKTDAWCRDLAQVHPPAFALPAHWAPLGITEYRGDVLPLGNDFIVTAHGSWNSDSPVGRLVARLHRTGDTITSFEPIVGERSSDNTLREGRWNARPVDVREGPDGLVYFSDDEGGRVFRIGAPGK